MQCNFNEGDKFGADRPLPITVLCTPKAGNPENVLLAKVLL